MPYIIQKDRKDPFLDPRETPMSMEETAELVGQLLDSGAELNYFFTAMIAAYMKEQGLRYQNISDVVGALEGAKQEFFRKVVNPYEELKEGENGPVYK